MNFFTPAFLVALNGQRINLRLHRHDYAYAYIPMCGYIIISGKSNEIKHKKITTHFNITIIASDRWFYKRVSEKENVQEDDIKRELVKSFVQSIWAVS